MADSFILTNLRSELEKAKSKGIDPRGLPELIEHVENLEKKARYSYQPQATIEDRIKNNSWDHNLNEVVDTIKGCIDGDWSWSRNTPCKYVTIHIDMRDGGFTLLNRGKERISLTQLLYQYGKSSEDIEIRNF